MSYNKLKTEFQVKLAKWLARRSLSFQQKLGRFIGGMIYVIPNSRKKVAQINISLCFPELNSQQANELLKQNLRSTGLGFMELLSAFWAPESAVQGKFEITGTEHLAHALKSGKGSLMLSCHCTSQEWGVRGLNHWLTENQLPIGHVLARQHNNKILEAHFCAAREAFAEKSIDKKDLRSLLKSIKSGHPVYYSPDQDFSYQIKYANFFNHPASTTIGTQKLAQKGVDILPWFCFRTAHNTWRIEILPLLTGLDELSEMQAAQLTNDLFEQQVRKHPEQYLWVHRRFKNQPDGMKNPYK